MKKFFTYFFCTLGVFFFILLCSGVYLWFADPFHIRPLITLFTTSSVNSVQSEENGTIHEPTTAPTSAGGMVDKNPALSAEQEQALETIGVDAAALPTTITPEMKDCFVGVLGATRVTEIQEGDTPTATEFFKARECL